MVEANGIHYAIIVPARKRATNRAPAHAFQKKSTQGIKTPKHEINLIAGIECLLLEVGWRG